MEVRDLQQRMRFLQEQLAPVTRQREYQEKEIQRLNKVGSCRMAPVTVLLQGDSIGRCPPRSHRLSKDATPEMSPSLTHTSLLLQALEEALNVQASPPPIFAGTLEPAGKVPPQELLTQNELLKQQVGPEGWEGEQSRASCGPPEGP